MTLKSARTYKTASIVYYAVFESRGFQVIYAG